MKGSMILAAALSAVILSGCGKETEPVQTEFADEILRILDETEPPEINISENSTAEEIMLAGKTAGMYYGEEAEKYFGYGGYYNRSPNYEVKL